jgi:hypothetical protein
MMDLRPGARPPANPTANAAFAPKAANASRPNSTTSAVPAAAVSAAAAPAAAAAAHLSSSSSSRGGADLEAELQGALARIQLLEKVIKDNGLRVP